MGLILPRWGSILPRIPPPTPVFDSAVTQPFLGYVHTQNSDTPNPALKHSFSLPELEVGKMNYSLGNLDPTGNWTQCLKSEQNFSRSDSNEQKKLFMFHSLTCHWVKIGHGNKLHVPNRILCKAPDLNQGPVLEKESAQTPIKTLHGSRQNAKMTKTSSQVGSIQTWIKISSF